MLTIYTRCTWKLMGLCTRVLQLPRPLPIFFYLLQNRRLPKKIRNTKFEKKKRFRGRTLTFFTQDLVFTLFCAARWCNVKSLLLMSHCKSEHSLLVLYIQKNFSTTSKTVYIYLCFLFFSESKVVKIDHVYVQGNYNRNSIWVRPAVSILAGCVKQSET